MHELTNVAPDRSLLVNPAGYVERTWSQHKAILYKLTSKADSNPDCSAAEDIVQDGRYFEHQLDKSFVYERVLPTPGSPRIEYQVFDYGLVVRTDFRGTEVKTITYDPGRMVRQVYDNVSKSVTTYPWLDADTVVWSGILNTPDEIKSPNKKVDENLGIQFSTDATVPCTPSPATTASPETVCFWQSAYTERSPSETYAAYSDVVGQRPDAGLLEKTKEMDAEYLAGKEILTKRTTACGVKPVTKPAAAALPAGPQQ